MTCYPFWNKTTKRVLNIGTAGGWTKSKYRLYFQKLWQESSQLVAFLQQDRELKVSYEN
jgi:lycopene beta-cyclase